VDIDNSILATNLLSEIKFSTSRSSGPGGQNVNKVNTKVSLRWNVVESAILLPDQKELLLKKWATRLTVDGALLIVSQEKRSQLQNKEDALGKLNQLLKEAFAKRKKRKKTKPSKDAVQKRLSQKKINSDKKKTRRAKE
jgi:ribosome-associated protein